MRTLRSGGKTSSKFSTNAPTKKAVGWSTLTNRKRRSSDPSTPPAANSTDSAAYRPADPQHHPQIPPTRLKYSPNLHARGLAAGSHSVGIIVSNFENPF